MRRTLGFISSLMAVLILLPSTAVSKTLSMEDSIKFTIVAGAICKQTAEEIGGDVDAYAEMSVISIRAAEKLGYTEDIQAFISQLKPMKDMLERELMKKHQSKVSIYNDWCSRVYNGFQNGLARGYSHQ